VADLVARIVGGEPVDLLEHLADRVARELVAAFPVERVRVAVHKPQAPLAVPFGDVVVTVERDA
jgi:dihydroneopterin aldolase